MTLTAHPVDDDERRLAALWDDQPAGSTTSDDAIGRLFTPPDGTDRRRDPKDFPGREHDRAVRDRRPRRPRRHAPRRQLPRPSRTQKPDQSLRISLAVIASAALAVAGSQLLTSASRTASDPHHSPGTAKSALTRQVPGDSRPAAPPGRPQRPRPNALREPSTQRRTQQPDPSKPRRAAHHPRTASTRASRPRIASLAQPPPTSPARSPSACDEFPPC